MAWKNHGPPWTDDRIATLKQRWHQGWSASQIAGELGGVTRNAVIGKAHRLGLSKSPERVAAERSMGSIRRHRAEAKINERIKVIKAKPAPKPPPPPKPAPVTQAPPTLPREPEVVRVFTAEALTATCCKWPIGDPARHGFGYCGAKKRVADVYCRAHARVAYIGAPGPAKRTADPTNDLLRSLRRWL